MALEYFKILYKLSPPCLNDLKSKYSFRYSNIVEIPRVKTTINLQKKKVLKNPVFISTILSRCLLIYYIMYIYELWELI
jgi:hypothetical protein